MLLLALLPSLALAEEPVAGRGALGSYEQAALSRSLSKRELLLDSSPEGKRIGAIHISNLGVFGADTGAMQILNPLHWTTRQAAVRSVLLIQPGEVWNPDRIFESERILRNPSMSSLVVIVPVQSEQAGVVDVLVVTRDIWSIRSNSEFIYQGGLLTYLKVAAAENNLLGRRKHVSLILEMDQGEYSLSTRWRDINVWGSRWRVIVRPRILFGRATKEMEGTQSFTTVEYPLWSLDSEWGFSFNATHKDAIRRVFLGSDLATYDNPDTEDVVEDVVQEFRRRDIAIRTNVSRSYRGAYKQTVGLGYELLSTRSNVLERLSLDEVLAEAFARDLFPREERSAAATLAYEFFKPQFVTYRNINSYDLPEIRAAGPSARIETALALKLFGSEKTFFRHRIRAGYLFDFQEEFFFDVGLTTARRHDLGKQNAMVDVEYGAEFFASSPVLPGAVRLVSYGDTTLTQNPVGNTIIQLGGQRDLRGYPLGTFTGTSFARASVEVRSLPYKLAFARVGYLAFWDVGGAANKPSQLRAHHNVGLGFKGLIPQTGASLFFLYWAIPLGEDDSTFPGRLSFGFETEL